jgi:hypothetical protein
MNLKHTRKITEEQWREASKGAGLEHSQGRETIQPPLP